MITTRFEMMKNFVHEELKQNPMSISYAVLVPVIFLIIIELIDTSEMASAYLNPNLSELIKLFSVIFHFLLYYILIFMVPIYIFISRYNKKCYLKYRNLNISFKEISMANLYTSLIFLDGFVTIFLGAIFLKTTSSISSILLFLMMVMIAIDIIVVILYLCFQIISNYICGIMHCSHMFIAELIIVIICTLLLYLPVGYISPLSLINVPIVLVLGIIITLLVVLYVIYRRMNIQNDYIKWESSKDTKVIQIKGNMNYLKNYVLMLFVHKGIYVEYAFSLIVLYCLLKLFDKIEIVNDGFFPLLIPMFLISSGIGYSYQQWYDLRAKKAMNITLIIDSIFSIIALLCTCCIVSVLIFGEIRTTVILFSLITYVSLMIMQLYLKLEFTSKAQLVFMFVYAFLSYVVYTALGLL